MTGLEKMKSQILDEAKAVADSKIAEAKAQAEEIMSQAKAEAEKKQASISQKSEAEIANYKERVASSIDLQRRTRVLAAKQDVIKEVLNEAYESLTEELINQKRRQNLIYLLLDCLLKVTFNEPRLQSLLELIRHFHNFD